VGVALAVSVGAGLGVGVFVGGRVVALGGSVGLGEAVCVEVLVRVGSAVIVSQAACKGLSVGVARAESEQARETSASNETGTASRFMMELLSQKRG
jgi:hypothetical protein